MALSKLLGLMADKMDYLSQRQAVIADNLANANTPNFKAKTISPFEDTLQKISGGQLKTTNPMHFTGTGGTTSSYKASVNKDVFEVKPSGNSVVVEQQMTDLADNNAQYQMITGFYRKLAGMLKTAIGRGGG